MFIFTFVAPFYFFLYITNYYLVVNLLLLIIIWSIDLPITEEYPFIFLKLKDEIFQKLNSNFFEIWILGGKELFTLEQNFTLNIGLYEYLLLLRLRVVNKNVSLTYWIWFDFCLILTALYSRWFNIGFIIGSILLPIVFYFFFLLMDYYEVMEEFMQIIEEALKSSDS